MKTTIRYATAALLLGSTGAFADDANGIVLQPAGDSFFRVDVGAAFRGGMKLNAKGAGSRAAGTVSSSSSSSGSASVGGKNSQTANLSFGYTGGDRTFGSGTTALGSGTIRADGTYTGGDYSAAYDDVYFSDNRTTTETVGGRTVTKTSSTATGGLSWKDDDLDGWGARLEAEVPLFEILDADFAVFGGIRGWWGIKGECSGSGAGVNYRTTTTTSGESIKTTKSFYDVTAPLLLNGKLDFENAEVFQGSTVTYTPADGSSSSKSSAAFSVAKIKAEADLYQVALGASLRFGLDRWTFSVRPALLLNDVDAEATRTEVLATAAGAVKGAWRETADENEFAIGAGIDLALECALDETWSLWVAGGYEWIDSVEFGLGPQKVEIDPSAWTVSAGVGFVW